MSNTPKFAGIPIPLHLVIWILILADCLYQHFVREQTFLHSIPLALFDGVLYTSIFWISIRLDLARVTLCYLALPYFFFIPGWLNTLTASCLFVIFIYSLWHTLRNTHSVQENSVTLHHLAAFMMILLWVNLSGAGGYGFQAHDYQMHNARLNDLVTYEWPVRYGENQNLVYYFGFFLPLAILGKFTSLELALQSVYPWVVFGTMLSLRWLSLLSYCRLSTILALVFILFGAWDIATMGSLAILTAAPVQNIFTLGNSGDLDFSLNFAISAFAGNYLSNTFQLFWSPQQVIPGWLGISLLSYLFLKQSSFSQWLFIYALLCLWAPFPMIALIPFVITATICQLLKDWRCVATLENILGAGSLAFVFIIFYLGGSGTRNPSTWLFSHLHSSTDWLSLAIFYLFGWGIYTACVFPFIRSQQNFRLTLWYYCLVGMLIILPVRIFGQNADLMCRGSAPLMFLLLMLLLRAIHHYWNAHRQMTALLLVCLLVPGWGSAMIHHRLAIWFYGHTKPITSIPDNRNAYPNLGPDNTLFERWLRKPLPPENSGRQTGDH